MGREAPDRAPSREESDESVRTIGLRFRLILGLGMQDLPLSGNDMNSKKIGYKVDDAFAKKRHFFVKSLFIGNFVNLYVRKLRIYG